MNLTSSEKTMTKWRYGWRPPLTYAPPSLGSQNLNCAGRVSSRSWTNKIIRSWRSLLAPTATRAIEPEICGMGRIRTVPITLLPAARLRRCHDVRSRGGTMGIKAIAFHEVIATDKIHELFGSPESQKQIETQQGKCVKCNLAFVIVLFVKSDPRNPE